MSDLLHLRITRIQPEIVMGSRFDAASYYLESTDGRLVPHRAGQFLTLILNQAGHEVRRSYSLSSTADEPLRLTIKRVENGQISRHLLDTVRVGDVLTSLPPAGRFVLDHDTPGDLVLIGAGSGITPLFSLLKQALRTEPDRRVTLLYSNRTDRTILFRDELNDLHRQYADRFRLIHLLSNPAHELADRHGTVRTGRLNNVMLETLLPELIGPADPASVQFFVCGPADYMRMVQFTLVFSGIAARQIRRENFVVEPVTLAPPPVHAVDRTVLLRYRGQSVEIAVPAYKSILQAALDEGVPLPYSCRGGRCSTCAARCTAGAVHMTINDVLTERDLAEGWILTCTGYPASNGVVIDV